jgi:hypothetical protein
MRKCTIAVFVSLRTIFIAALNRLVYAVWAETPLSCQKQVGLR